jgi:hypothetical protein
VDFINRSRYNSGILKALTSSMSDLDKDRIREKLQELRVEHRDLDEALLRLGQAAVPDMLSIQRMKKRKLVIKDMIIKYESMLIDDIIA